MRIALTGASGFIGSLLSRRLSGAGHLVTALVRESSRRDHIEPFVDCFVVGDHGDESCWGKLLDGAEGVIHNSFDWQPLGGYGAIPEPENFLRHIQRNLVTSLNLLRVSDPLPFVFMSTIAVHHDLRPRWEGLIDEDHPLRPATSYGAYKAAVEAHLWSEYCQSGRHTVAIRPSGVYGVDPNLRRSYGYGMIRRIRERDRAHTKAGGGKFVHVEDVAAATVAAVTTPGAAGRAFNLADCYARWADWAKMACELLGVEREIDFSSPDHPKNTFLKDATRDVLGVDLDRGHEGIREHLRELIAAIDGV